MALALSPPLAPPPPEEPVLQVEVVRDGMDAGAGGGGGRPAQPPLPVPVPQPVPITRVNARPTPVKPRPRPTPPAPMPTPLVAAIPNPQGAAPPPAANGEGEHAGAVPAGDGPSDHGRGGAHAGTGTGGGGDQMASYLGRLRRTIQDHLIYPPMARRIGLTGLVQVHFLIRPDGSVDLSSLRTTGGTDDDILQRSALDTIRRVAAFPPPPMGAVGIQVPVSFTLTPR